MMKNFLCKKNIFLFCLYMLVFMPGCVDQPLRFQIVDGNTKVPLSGVIIDQVNMPVLLLIPEFSTPRRTVDVVYPMTRSDGYILTQPLDVYHYEFSFTFRKSGYENTHAVIDHTKMPQFHLIPPRQEPSSEDLDKLHHFIITVPLYPSTGPSTKILNFPTTINTTSLPQFQN